MPEIPDSPRRASALERAVLRYRRPIVVALYVVLSWASNIAAFLARFDGQVPASVWSAQWAMLPWLIGLRLAGFATFGQFRGLWRYASVYDLWNIIAAVVSSTLVFFVLARWVFAQHDYPRSIFLIDCLLLVTTLGALRMARRVYYEVRHSPKGKRVLIIGAGNAGEMVVRDMLHNPAYDYRPVGFIDDDEAKQGEQIHGVPVLGKCADLVRILEKTQPEDVLIAIPSAPPSVRRDLVRALQPFKLAIRTLPSLNEVVSGRVEVSQIRNLAIEDLLARPPVGLSEAPLRRLIASRRVMVTGAGGSIGSELCRQIATFSPQTLLLFERYENSLFAIHNELHDKWRGLDILPLVGDVCDEDRLAAVFSLHAPHIVFHAAAHKHVPLMELSPAEAVKNNVFGTRMLADAASRFGVDRFILISTDKAVNPTSAMGVSKRVAEMIVQSKDDSSESVFAVVRFGNVLGSNGSVVPRFLDQIKAGGPVTVTHPDMQRYFMLIPEAVQLVMHAAAVAEGGEVFVLDMGEPMKVLDMARTLIRLSGFVPETDIPIAFTGLRPGEKLYEELVGADESIEASAVEKISKIERKQLLNPAELDKRLGNLRRCAATGNLGELRHALQELVPTYRADLN